MLGISLAILCVYQTQAAGSLYSYWKFDETTAGSTAVDSSGNGYHGTPQGSAGAQNGPQPSTEVPSTTFENGRSLVFDGDDDYVDVSTWSGDASEGFTVALWARPTATNSGARFIDFGNGPGSDNIIFGRSNTSTDFFFEVYDGSSSTKVTALCNLINNSWHHYAATVDSEGNTVLYKDGMSVATGTVNVPRNLSRSNMYIGRSNWEDDGYYEGEMDELRLYGRALTSAEIVELASGELGPIPSPIPSPTPTVTLASTPTPTPTTPTVATSIVPNDGDANNDGTPDVSQSNLYGFVSPITNRYVLIAAPSICQLSSVTNNDAKDNAGQDSGYSYPTGLLNYTARCGTPGYTATMKLYFYGMDAKTYALRKYDPATHGYSTITDATFEQTTIGGESVIVVTYQVVDGGILDTDGLGNGVIIDPVGPAVQKVSVPNTGC